MDKLKMHTPDLTAGNVERLAELFPSCVVESRDDDGELKRAIDFDLLRQELSDHIVEGPQERYRLDWPGKREALLAANAPIAKTLRPCREESVDFDTTQNLFIEGDNLDALKLLQETYLGKVKMIYIDPPYNTGKDFIYEDDFAENAEEYMARSNQTSGDGRLVANSEANGRFHSDWISLMYSRLKLARNLLCDDGIAFISIDDGEVGNLRKVCDEIFGESNFIANVVWQKKYTRANDARWFSDNHDHLLCVAKNKLASVLNLQPRTDEQLAAYSNPDGHPKGKWKATPLHAKSGTNTSSYTFSNGVRWCPPSGTFRRFNDEAMKKMDANGEIWFGADGEQVPQRKSFLSEVKDGVSPVTIWPYDEVGHNHEANSELKSLGLGGMFNNPKPTRLLLRALSLATSSDSVVMDFFAGSGTTAHAVMALNAKDGGSRRCISIQLPETTDEGSVAFKAGHATITELAKERIRRAGKKIKSDHAGKDGIENLDIGFRVLKIDTSNMAQVYYRPDELKQDDLLGMVDNVRPDRTAEDLLFQVLLDWGVDLALPIVREQVAGREVFFVDGDALAACFVTDGSVDEDFVKALAERKPLRAVFRDSGFANDNARINVEQIFKAMSPTTEVKTI